VNRNLSFNDTASAALLMKLYKQWNHGLINEVAKQLGISHQAVSKVYEGHARSARVEAALAARGLPVHALFSGPRRGRS